MMRGEIIAAIVALAIGVSAGAAPKAKAKAKPPAHAAEIAQAKRAVAESLKDPASVQFRDIRVVKYGFGVLVCGQYNAKNGYGGYVGFGPFVVSEGEMLDPTAAGYGQISLNCYR